MKTKSFSIATLSGLENNLGALAQDPITIITAGSAFLQTLFPNLFGSNRTRLTMSDWQKILPGSGYWTVKLRAYFNEHIHYDTNLDNMAEFTKYFVHNNQQEICGIPNYPAPYDPSCLDKFYSLLQNESVSGGTGIPGVTLPCDRIDDITDHHQRGCFHKWIDHGRFGSRDNQHIARIDGLPTTDTRAVKTVTIGEYVLI